MPKTLEEEYEEALKGYDHPSLDELYERHPELRVAAFQVGMYKRMLAYFHPEAAAQENQPPTK